MKILLVAAMVIASPAMGQSTKPISKAEFEAQQLRKWQRYDLDGDTKLTPEEMLKVRPTRQDGAAYTLESVRKSLMKRDTNGDGSVTVAEAVAAELPRFDTMDTNKDGSVSPEERASEPK